MAISVMTWVWNHSRSRHGARLVLLAIADCASGDGANAWPSNAELRRKAGIGERAVQIAIAELVKLGELDVRYNEGPGGCNRYQVVMTPRNISTPAANAPPQNLRGSGKSAAKSKQVSTETPAESAPPQISHEPPQILRGPPAESAPVTVLEPKANQHQKTSSSGDARKRATRLPEDFGVTPEMVDWARAEVPGLIGAQLGSRETDKFRDHWRQASGATARKLDWVAAWRNWMRRADDDLARNGGRPSASGAKPSTTDQRVAQGEALKAELAAARNGGLQLS